MNPNDLDKKLEADFHYNKLLVDKQYENQLPILSNKAKIFIQTALVANQNLYILIEGGGCHGLQYKFLIANDYNYDCTEIYHRVYVDSASLVYMWGSIIDVTYDNEGKSLSVENPYAKQSCSCKVSFSL